MKIKDRRQIPLLMLSAFSQPINIYSPLKS